MLFTVHQSDFAQAVATAAKAVSTRNTLPILSGILLKAEGSTLQLTATDLEIGIEVRIPAQIEQAGQVVLPARYLTEIVRRIPDETVRVEIDPRNFTAVLRWGKSQYTIHGNDAEQFPYLPEPAGPDGYRIDQALLRHLIRQTAFAVAHDESRPILAGAQFRFAPPDLQVIATDGVRIAYRRGKLQTESTEAREVVIPGRTLNELSRLLGADADAMVTIRLTDSQAFFEMDGLRLVSRLLEGQYPDVLRLIPQNYSTRLQLPTQEFFESCERAALIARDGNNAIKLDIQPDRLVITSSVPEVGQVYEELAATMSGEPLEIGLNPRFLTEGLRVLDAEEFVFEFTGNRTPTKITPLDGDHFFYVVLPIVVW